MLPTRLGGEGQQQREKMVPTPILEEEGLRKVLFFVKMDTISFIIKYIAVAGIFVAVGSIQVVVQISYFFNPNNFVFETCIIAYL